MNTVHTVIKDGHFFSHIEKENKMPVDKLMTFRWYMLDCKRIWMQKILGEWHYWNMETGWVKLSEMDRNQLEEFKEDISLLPFAK
jgi:hypothetical protein